MTKRIATLTLNPALDVSTAVDRVRPTHKLRCETPRYDPGGGGINVARVIHQLGGEAVAVFPVGGGTGDMLRDLLAHEGVTIVPVPMAGRTRVSFTVHETTREDEYRFVLPGPELGPEEWQSCRAALARIGPDYLVASGSLPPGLPATTYAELADLARARGVRLVVDASGEALRAAFGHGAYLVKPSLRELEDMLGTDLSDPARQEAVCRDLIARGACEVLALTLGAEGALLTWAGGQLRLPSPKVEVRSAVGAGDSFVAAMVFKLAAEAPLAEAFRYGIAAGAAALLTPGTELCRREDVERLYAGLRAQAPVGG